MRLLLNPRFWIALAIAAALAFALHFTYRAGKANVRAAWDAEKVTQQKADIQAGIVNAKETQRRLDRQKENQDAQNQELANARADAVRNGADADGMRVKLASTAQRWRDALGNTATSCQCAAASDAIGVLADVLGRADRRAGELAIYADAARIAGLKCERDYDALMLEK